MSQRARAGKTARCQSASQFASVPPSTGASVAAKKRALDETDAADAGSKLRLGLDPVIDNKIKAGVKEATGTVELSVQPGFTANMDATSLLQSLIDNPAVRAISINQSISISTVTIPPNRPIKIGTNRPQNVIGTPLITVLPGGSGIRLNGSGGNLVVGVFLDGLSFTSADQAVVGAITGQSVTGLYGTNLTFLHVKGPALRIDGIFYDSTMENVVAMDCGDTGKAVIQYGAGSDANRITWTNLRVERSASTQLLLEGSAYDNDFLGCKFHGPVTDGAAGIVLGAGAKDNHFIGGQVFVAVTIAGVRNLLTGLMFTLTSDTVAAVTMTGQQNQVMACEFINVWKPVAMTGELNEFVDNEITGVNLITATGPFSKILRNTFVSSFAPTGVDRLINMGAYGICSQNTFKAFEGSNTYVYVIVATTASIVQSNMVYASGARPPGNVVYATADNMIIKDNIGVGVTDSAVKQFTTDATRIVADNKKI